MTEVLALIPARAGSKGVPGKNLRKVAGLSLIEYAIKAAQAAENLTTIAVTSDDADALAEAKRHRVLALKRPEGISEDASPVTLAVQQALKQAEQIAGKQYDVVVLLQPTAPLRTGTDIKEALALFAKHGKSVCSVSRCDDNHPARMYRIEDDQQLSPLLPEIAGLRRQDLPPVYLRNGALYVFSRADAIDGKIIKDDMTAYVMPSYTAINIDSELDLLVLDAFMARNTWTF